MINITGIEKGIVIDHIKAGHGIKIFNYLGLDKADFTVALIKNASSCKTGKKDIIKIDNVIDLDFTVLGLIDPSMTINIIEGEKVKEKIKPELPDKVENIIKCKNPRCVTSIERDIDHIFLLVDPEKGQYRCQYCDEVYTLAEV